MGGGVEVGVGYFIEFWFFVLFQRGYEVVGFGGGFFGCFVVLGGVLVLFLLVCILLWLGMLECCVFCILFLVFLE